MKILREYPDGFIPNEVDKMLNRFLNNSITFHNTILVKGDITNVDLTKILKSAPLLNLDSTFPNDWNINKVTESIIHFLMSKKVAKIAYFQHKMDNRLGGPDYWPGLIRELFYQFPIEVLLIEKRILSAFELNRQKEMHTTEPSKDQLDYLNDLIHGDAL